jgi:hypothetical protein
LGFEHRPRKTLAENPLHLVTRGVQIWPPKRLIEVFDQQVCGLLARALWLAG